ncbi:MAG TPA: transcriptional regulator BetI [Paracoccaceae bacterium]|nr:transcriptional regulator BetI [Paracoccaceae bacterium]
MDTAAPRALNDDDRKRRKASKELRRQQLIEATIDCLAKFGYAETTLANVADLAGLSRGIVNFHFESKEKLLVATLQFMADEYAAHWRAALKKAGPAPADRLRALVEADFDRNVSNRRKLAAWVAFWGEAKSRPTYKALCGARDEAYQNTVTGLFAELVAATGRPLSPEALAAGLDALLEGLWLRLMMGADGFRRADARQAARTYLAMAFPSHFAFPAPAAPPAETQ